MNFCTLYHSVIYSTTILDFLVGLCSVYSVIHTQFHMRDFCVALSIVVDDVQRWAAFYYYSAEAHDLVC